ncbi:AMIN domain-containing protein [Nostoc sp. UHCC 0302]|uniref:AMIN domain-containing protein n=1 Tax=Nostoc sp. UHCC 0302 TaxID=3134896 RepID=UPI00311CD5C6
MQQGLRTREFFQCCKQLFSVSLFGLYAVIAIETGSSAAAPVAKLNNWRFYPEKLRLEINLSAGTTPRYFYLAQPPRIVVDLPDTKLGSVATQQNYSGAIQKIRVSQLSPSVTRIVLDLAANTSFNPKQLQLQPFSPKNPTRWVLRPVSRSSSTAVQPKKSPASSNKPPQTTSKYQPPSNLPQTQYNYSQPPNNQPLTSTNLEQTSFMVLPPSSNLLPTNTNSQQPFVTVPPLTPNNPSQPPSSILPPPSFSNQPSNLNNLPPLKSEFPTPTNPNYPPNVPKIEVIEFGQPLPKNR